MFNNSTNMKKTNKYLSFQRKKTTWKYRPSWLGLGSKDIKPVRGERDKDNFIKTAYYIFIASSQLTTNIHWSSCCTVHFFCHSFLWKYVVLLSGSEYVVFYRLLIYVYSWNTRINRLSNCWSHIFNIK
jgi:hypothetical protein